LGNRPAPDHPGQYGRGSLGRSDDRAIMNQAHFPNQHDRHYTVVLINSEGNPEAVMDKQTFSRDWHWLQTPRSWKPSDPLPADLAIVDAVIVFSLKQKEQEVELLCRTLRREPSLKEVPLLVAVNQYQMPLANRMRELPNTDFVLTPIEEASLLKHLNWALESAG